MTSTVKRLRVMASAAVAGAGAAMLPLVALAQEHGAADFEAANRATDPSADWGLIMFVTAAATGGLFLLSAIGYLYRRERGLEWRFQRPDAPHADH